uniref:Electron transporter/ thiol-disulfide exchange intermediate n=1 Tax=Zea mays TaxID=4577 RepID=B6U0D0_MAIZE|nr:electron transporter/ thiol-disulfide exchange intermediate [Zea mays]
MVGRMTGEMGGLRSRILRTLQSFPTAAPAQSPNLILAPLPPGAGPSPQPPAAPCVRLQEPAPLGDEARAAPEVPGGGGDDDKENVSPGATPRKAKKMKLSSDHHDRSPGLGEEQRADGATRYRRPDLASATLFDPDLLAAFRRAVDAYAQALDAARRRDVDVDDGDGVPGGGGGPGVADPLDAFERRCPPGGERAVVLYTTSIRGVRRTFEDCARVRRLLGGLRVAFLERDVSMHAPYREELRALLLCERGEDGGGAFPVPPRLFVDGRYLGGADEVVALHERSQLRPVLRRAAWRGAGEGPCAVCGGAWFVVCGACGGSHWLHDASAGAGRVPCSACNENGLVPCPLCS